MIAAALLGLQVTVPDFPGIGNTLPVALLFLLHVSVAEYSVGAITLAVAMEAWGSRTGDVRALRYAKSAGTSYYLVFSLGATLAVFAVVLLFGLWSDAIGTLLNVLMPLIGVAFLLFLVLTPLLVVYKISFEKWTPGWHALLGLVVALLQTLFVVLIVGLDTYLITPQHGGLIEASLNPPYIWLLIHRLAGNVSWAALFLAAYAAMRMRRLAPGPERDFQAWAARVNLRIGLIIGVLMPVDGFVLVEVLKQSQFGFFSNLVGTNGNLMIIQEAMFATLLIGGNIALVAERGARVRSEPLGVIAIVLSLAGMTLACMPAAVLSGSLLPLRYVGLGTATLVTFLHVLLRIRGRPVTRGGQRIITPTLRRSLVVVGVVSLFTALFMGYIKEHARGDYAIYGELKQNEAHTQFSPPPELYP